MALAFAAPAWPAPPAAGDPPPFGAGDWTVTGSETFADRSIILAGNLLIMPGGSLTISNATLTVFSSYPLEHELRVLGGGTLVVRGGSLLNSFDPENEFGFVLEENSTAAFSNSTFLACGVWYNEVYQMFVGGIISYTHLLTVENCTFAGSHVALTTYAPARFTTTSFTANYIGVIGIRTALDFTCCSFSDNTLIGAWPYRSTAGFSNCTFMNNSLGIASDESTCKVQGCRFARNSGNGLWASAMMHWFMGPSVFLVEDCLFEENAIGIGHYPDVADSKLQIINCDFLDNSLALDWENDGDSGNPSPGATSWNVTRPCLARNNRFLLNGNIRVEGGGSLDLGGSNLTFDSDFNGESGLQVDGGGRLELSNGSILRMNWGSYPYRLECGPGSAFSMGGSVLRDCGWDSTSMGGGGPLFDGASVRINSSVIDYNPVALTFNHTRDAIIEGSSLRGLEWAPRLSTSTALFRNCSLASPWGAWLSDASGLECVNSTVGHEQGRFDDGASRLNLSWYLDVRARWADGSPAEGATVSVSDRAGARVALEELGADGRLRGLVLRELSMGLEETTRFTPHTVNCSLGTIHNLTAQTMDRSRSLDIVLEDRDAPAIAIDFPGPDQYLSSGAVLVNGTARDNLAVDDVELVVDGFRRVAPVMLGGPFQPEVRWEAMLALAEGLHSVEARCSDRAGNSASVSVSFTVDWSSPRIRIASPSDNHVTNRSILAVSGYMEPGVRVFLEGYEVRTERDTFGGTVVLGEGGNLVTATAVDRAGNANTSSVRVVLDTRPPALLVHWPPDGLRTNVPVVAVNGTMEPGADVFVNGRLLVPSGEPGVFGTSVALPREVNFVAVDAVDGAGNHNLTVIVVIVDTRPPALDIESPAEGALVNRSDVWLTGTSEGGAQLSVDGCLTLVAGAPGSPARFSIPLALKEGPNTVYITASDAAGNFNFSARHLAVDTVAPALAVLSPENGNRTSRSTVFVIGESEPGTSVTVNSRPVEVGQTGSFSLEVRLSMGQNRIAVRAVDAAGNSNETAVTVQRLAAAGDDIVRNVAGPDWPFAGFVLLAAGVCVSEWLAASRFIRRSGGI